MVVRITFRNLGSENRLLFITFFLPDKLQNTKSMTLSTVLYDTYIHMYVVKDMLLFLLPVYRFGITEKCNMEAIRRLSLTHIQNYKDFHWYFRHRRHREEILLDTTGGDIISWTQQLLAANNTHRLHIIYTQRTYAPQVAIWCRFSAQKP